MAKTVSPIFKFQGTIEDLTFVNSRRYKPHVRAKKYSKTAFVMTAPLAEGKARMQQCNQYAKPIFQALRAEVHDGALWSRLVSKLFTELKAGRPLGLECLKCFECNLQHPLGEVIGGGYDLSATVSQNQLGLYVQLHQHPVVADEMPRTGYQVRFVVIIPDAANGTVTKVEGLGPLTKYKEELSGFDLPIKLPEAGGPCLLLMGIVPHLQNEGPVKIMSDSGMRVVWVGEVGSGRDAAVSSVNATAEVAALAAGDTEKVAAGERLATGSRCRETSFELRTICRRLGEVTREGAGNGTVEAVGFAVDEDGKVKTVVVGDEGTVALMQVSGSKGKGPEPLLIDKARHPGQGLTGGADHEDAAFVLALKSGLAPRANNEDDTLLNTHHRAGSGSHEIILYNKTFKNEKITAKAACSIQCGMSARPKRNAE